MKLARALALVLGGLFVLALVFIPRLLGSGQGAGVTDGTVRLVVWHSQRGREKDVLEELLRAFNDKHRGAIIVEPLAVPDGSFKDKVLRTIPRGAGPDVFLRPHNELGEFLRDGILREVTPAAFPAREGEYFPRLVEGVSRGEQRFGVPLTFKALVLFYDRGVYPNGPPATLEALLEKQGAAKTVMFPLAYDATSLFHHAPFYLIKHGPIAPDGVLVPFDGEAQTAFDLPRDWRSRGLLPQEISYNDAVRLFEEGSAATLLNGPWYTPRDGQPVGVSALPTFDGKPMGSFVTIEAAFVASSTRHAAEAERLVAFLAGQEAASLRASTLGLAPPFPISGDSASSPLILAQTESLKHGEVTPSSVAMAAVWNPADELLKASGRGEDLAPMLVRARETAAAAGNDRSSAGRPVALGIFLVLLLALVTMQLVRRVRLDVASPENARARLLGASGSSAWGFLMPGLVSTALLVLVPAIVAALMSFFELQDGSFVYVGTANFADILAPSWDRVFASRSFYFALGVTILWTFVNVVLHLSLGMLLAIALRPAWVKMRTLFRVLLVLPWAIPNYITALMWKGMFHAQVGAINALLAPFGFKDFPWFNEFHTAFFANVITNTWLGFPFMMVVTLGALTNIPKEVEEAAVLDGATRMQRFFWVLFPYLRPALVPAVILGSVWTFNMFNVVYLVSGGEPASQTDILISEAYRWAFERGQRFGYAAAYSVLIFVFLLGYGRLTSRLTDEKASPA